MKKIINLDDRFYTGEPTLMVVAQRGHRGWLMEKQALASSGSPALDYIQTVQPEDGNTIILVNALGAFETYDDNRNGDAFPELTYNVGKLATCGHASCQTRSGWITPEETLLQHYLSFEKYGNVFEHHLNKDPSRSLGQVIKAFWNSRMHRVELLLRVVNNRKPELIQRINDGEYPAVSMGCRVRWDVCSVCGHHAPTRKDYCNHLRFDMRKIDPITGIRYCALNPSPGFFDISIVVRPADTTGFMLKKVASVYDIQGFGLEDKIAQFEEKQALVRKLSDIQKELVGDTLAVNSRDDAGIIRKYRDTALSPALAEKPQTGESEYDAMQGFSLPEVFSTLASKNASLTISECVRLAMKKLGSDARPFFLDKIAALQPVLHEVFAQHPDLFEELLPSVKMSQERVRPELAQKLGSWLDKRASVGDWMTQQFHEHMRGAPLGPSARYEAQAAPRTDVLTMTDPNTGEMYRTTRGAAMSARHQDYKSLLGSSALLGAAYTLALGLHPMSKAMPFATRALVGVPAGVASAIGLKRISPLHDGVRYMTDQGYEVPGSTEFRKSSSLLEPSLLDKLAADYYERGATTNRALMNKVASVSGESDAVVRILQGDMRQKVGAWLSSIERPSYDPGEPNHVSFNDIAPLLGALITG